jgi:hypothetical protein
MTYLFRVDPAKHDESLRSSGDDYSMRRSGTSGGRLLSRPNSAGQELGFGASNTSHQ